MKKRYLIPLSLILMLTMLFSTNTALAQTGIWDANTFGLNLPYQITGQAHIQNIGWDKTSTCQTYSSQYGISAFPKEGDLIIGRPGQSLRVEAVVFSLQNFPKSGGFLGIGAKTIATINYEVTTPAGYYVVEVKTPTYFTVLGVKLWQSGTITTYETRYNSKTTYYGYDGGMAGTTGCSKPIQTFRLWLTGAPNGIGIQYSVYIEGLGWTGWASSNTDLGIDGRNIEAISVRFLTYI